MRLVVDGINTFVGTGGRKFDAWYATLRVAEVDFPDEDAFRNINTLEELRKFETA